MAIGLAQIIGLGGIGAGLAGGIGYGFGLRYGFERLFPAFDKSKNPQDAVSIAFTDIQRLIGGDGIQTAEGFVQGSDPVTSRVQHPDSIVIDRTSVPDAPQSSAPAPARPPSGARGGIPSDQCTLKQQAIDGMAATMRQLLHNKKNLNHLLKRASGRKRQSISGALSRMNKQIELHAKKINSYTAQNQHCLANYKVKFV